MHRLRVLDRAIVEALLQLGRVVEEARGDGLADGIRLLRRRVELELDALHQPLDLLSDVARLAQGAHLGDGAFSTHADGQRRAWKGTRRDG